MTVETIPAEVPDDVWAIADLETRRGIWLPRGEVAQAIARAILADRSIRPAEPAALTVDTIAAFLHKEVEWPEDNYPAYAWPEVDGDTGQRDGGYVKIVPKYVVEEFRGIARRLLIAFRQEGVVPTEPAAPVAEAGDGEVVAWRRRRKGCVGAERTWTMCPMKPERDREFDLEPLVRLSTLEAERARANAAEQRAADALARAEKAEEDERDRLYELASNHGGWAVPVVVPGFIRDCGGAMLPHERRAAREAQPATDGGEA